MTTVNDLSLQVLELIKQGHGGCVVIIEDTLFDLIEITVDSEYPEFVDITGDYTNYN